MKPIISISKAALLLVLIVFIGGCTERQQAGPNRESLNESETDASPLYRENESSHEQSPLPKPDATEVVRTRHPERPTPTPSPTAVTSELASSSRLVNWTKEGGVRIGGISSCTLIKNGEYFMYYTGRGIELARSSDGLNFVYWGRLLDVGDVDYDLDMVTNPAVFETSDGKYRMLFEGSKMLADRNDRKLYSAISSDGLTWAAEEGVRFQDAGDGKPGELFTSVPDVIRLSDNGKLRMYYTRGATSATALSGDDGLTWTKEADLDLMRKVAIDPDIVLLEDGTYKLFFTTFEGEFGVGEQWVVGASSTDGTSFTLDEGKLIAPSAPGGLITDPDVIRTNDGYRMYYGEFEKSEGGLYGGASNILSAFSPAT